MLARQMYCQKTTLCKAVVANVAFELTPIWNRKDPRLGLPSDNIGSICFKGLPNNRRPLLESGCIVCKAHATASSCELNC